MVSHLSLTDIVKGTCGLVKQQYGGIGYQSPRYQYALLLSATESRISFAHHCMHLHRHLSYVISNASHLCRSPRIFHRAVWSRDGYITENIA